MAWNAVSGSSSSLSHRYRNLFIYIYYFNIIIIIIIIIFKKTRRTRTCIHAARAVMVPLEALLDVVDLLAADGVHDPTALLVSVGVESLHQPLPRIQAVRLVYCESTTTRRTRHTRDTRDTT
jgi:hypothetical protein